MWPADNSARPAAGLHGPLWRLGKSDLSGTDSLQQRVREKVARVMARCAAVDVFVAAQLDFSSTTDDVESIYSDLQLFARALHAVGDSAAGGDGAGPSELGQLIEMTGRLLESERYLSHQVNQWLLHLQSRRGAEPSFALFPHPGRGLARLDPARAGPRPPEAGAGARARAAPRGQRRHPAGPAPAGDLEAGRRPGARRRARPLAGLLRPGRHRTAAG